MNNKHLETKDALTSLIERTDAAYALLDMIYNQCAPGSMTRDALNGVLVLVAGIACDLCNVKDEVTV